MIQLKTRFLLQNTPKFIQCTGPSFFIHKLKYLWNSSMWISSNSSKVLCFTSSTSAKYFPFGRMGQKYQVVETWINKADGRQPPCLFWLKRLLNAQILIIECAVAAKETISTSYFDCFHSHTIFLTTSLQIFNSLSRQGERISSAWSYSYQRNTSA